MSRENGLIILSCLIALAPFIGLPYAVLMGVELILGLLTLILAVSLRARRAYLERAAEPHEIPSV